MLLFQTTQQKIEDAYKFAREVNGKRFKTFQFYRKLYDGRVVFLGFAYKEYLIDYDSEYHRHSHKGRIWAIRYHATET
mgnify:CR=1 FL=1